MSSQKILVVDQGTTSTRSLVMEPDGKILGFANEQIQQIYPHNGWVEHSPNQIWNSVKSTIITVLNQLNLKPENISAIGITNQRETTILWNPKTGKPYYNAIVWQDVRTTEICKTFSHRKDFIHKKAGLFPNPYFSATKIKWILEKIRSENLSNGLNQIHAGTVDTFLVWNLTSGKSFLTDHSNASRTMLMDLETGKWDDELLNLFGIPREILPEIQPSSSLFGTTSNLDFLPDGIPIYGVAGDQQASLVGHRCNIPGLAKCTFGTGAFLLQHTGKKIIHSKHGLLTTLAATLSNDLEYALEGSVFIAGAAIQFLRDSLGFFNASADSENLAKTANKSTNILFIPALTGLGTPYWDSSFQGSILGLTRNISKKEITLAALEGVSHQLADLLEETEIIQNIGTEGLSIDGGMTANTLFNQILSNITGISMAKAHCEEMTAVGAGLLAALGAGFIDKQTFLENKNASNRSINPTLSSGERIKQRNRWKSAIQALKGFYSS